VGNEKITLTPQLQNWNCGYCGF